MSPHNKRSSNSPDWMELSLILARFDTRCHKFLFTLIAWRWHRFCWLFNFLGGINLKLNWNPVLSKTFDICPVFCYGSFFPCHPKPRKTRRNVTCSTIHQMVKENSKYSVLIFCFRIHANDSCQTPYFVHAAFQF